MPFTISHPAAAALVWPIVRRARIPFAALAIGTMSPDFEFFFHLSPRALLSHTLPGLLLFCVPAGLAVFAAWEFLARDAVRALLGMDAGDCVHHASRRLWVLASIGVVLGAATHLAWDGLTHGSYWGAERWPWLRESAFMVGDAAVPWFNALQHLSTVSGGLVVLIWSWVQVRRTGDVSILWQTAWRARAVALIIGMGLLAAAANGSRGPFGTDFWTLQRLLGRVAVGGLLGLGLGVMVFALRYRRVQGAT